MWGIWQLAAVWGDSCQFIAKRVVVAAVQSAIGRGSRRETRQQSVTKSEEDRGKRKRAGRVALFACVVVVSPFQKRRSGSCPIGQTP